MSAAQVFNPPADDGNPGWVKLADGQIAYRYEGSDDLIVQKGSASEQAPTNRE